MSTKLQKPLLSFCSTHHVGYDRSSNFGWKRRRFFGQEKFASTPPAGEGAIFKIEDLVVLETGDLEAEIFLSRCRYDVLRLGIALVDIAIVSDDAYGA